MTILNNLSSDYDSILSDIEGYLQSQSTTIKALFPGETSKIFTELLAGVTAYLSFRIDMATLNAFMPTVINKSAAYANAQTVGDSPSRKRGGSGVCSLSVYPASTVTPGSLFTIPAFTEIVSNNYTFHTRESQSFPIKLTKDNNGNILPQLITFNIYEGEVVNQSVVSSGDSFQRISLGKNFTIDNDTVSVTIDDITWNKDTFSLSQYTDTTDGSMNVYVEKTMADGSVLLLFGNGTYGNVPLISKSINIRYTNTLGLIGNKFPSGSSAVFKTLSLPSSVLSSINTMSIGSISGGSDEESIDTIKYTAPRLFAANRRGVRRDDYSALILKYGIFSSTIAWGEYEEALDAGYQDNSMMNRVWYTGIKSDASLSQNSINITTSESPPYTFSGYVSSSAGLGNNPYIIPGSFSIKYNPNSLYTFYDIGYGILCNDNYYTQALTGGSASSNSSSSAYPVSNAFDTNINSEYRSAAGLSTLSVLRVAYDLGLGNSAICQSFRLRSNSQISADTRNFPKKVSIWGSNVVNPNLSNDDDWVRLSGDRTLIDPGVGSWTPWIPIGIPRAQSPNNVAYRNYMLRIVDSYGNGNYISFDELQLQDISYTSTVNYQTGQLSIIYPTNIVTGGGQNAQTSYLSMDLTNSQISNINAYLDQYIHFTTQLNYRSPQAIPVDVKGIAYYKPSVLDVGSVNLKVLSQINNLFKFDRNSLGKDFRVSDLYAAVDNIDGIDYIELSSPTSSVPTSIRNAFIWLRSVSITMLPSQRVSS